ncbi:uncharacterized protein LOC130613687 [Hydractinia symbiolongicarpus]|uniref:uncharacterized protein LOC130613687 n=1 Tax=Hydractinia symbiolongicarpus TaxID=13093 RepID=UPI00254C0D35|nr:uncharacterized protein LOC130613687 [Hydractinia symbiolongicarpus]
MKVAHWLSRQLLWLRHIKGPKRIDYPHFTITKPNEVHQLDLLYMPHDRVYGNTYKYILTGIDVASRYKVARPLRTKKGSKVADMIRDIYKARPLRQPKTFQCDNGSEFKSDVTKLQEDQDVKIKRATTNYHHTFTAFVESYNKVLAESLFKPQDAQELVSGEPSTIWVKHLYAIEKSLNNSKTAIIGQKPSRAIKLDEVPLAKSEEYPEENPYLTMGCTIRYNQENNMATRKDVQLTPFEANMLTDGPERSFVLEELMQGT